MSGSNPLVIAHRGASGYLPEHTLEAKVMAHGQRANFLEQDIVLTRDNVPIVLHDIYLDGVSDVATRFPDRKRADGRYYAIDFLISEIQSLRAFERFDPRTLKAVFPSRFPTHTGNFKIPTLVEELELIQGLNHSTGHSVGIYPEIKQPAFHHQAGKDISAIVLDVLLQFGYDSVYSPCYVQCFDENELVRIRTEFKSKLKLILLYETETLRSVITDDHGLQKKLKQVSTYANGIGPSLELVFGSMQQGLELNPMSRLVENAHRVGLDVHAWTCRADQILPKFHSFADLHDSLIQVRIDGCFTDFPDLTLALFNRFGRRGTSLS